MAETLTPQQRHTNRLVVEGLHHAMLPVQSWTSFPAYLQNLATLPGTLLRERLLDAYLDIAREPKMGCAPGEEIQIPTREALIASVDVYLDFLERAFGEFDHDLEAEAHALVQHPDTMKRVIVEHLGFMWEQHLAEEWTRALPLLQESIDAFRQVRLDGLDKLEAIRTVTGQDTPDEKWRWIAGMERIVFVPSAHVGPYLGKLHLKSDPGQLYLIYGARLPEGIRAARPASALSRAELVVRFSALADDTRLRILALLGEQGELCAQDIITALDLSQSAASRHLTQLSATGLPDRASPGKRQVLPAQPGAHYRDTGRPAAFPASPIERVQAVFRAAGSFWAAGTLPGARRPVPTRPSLRLCQRGESSCRTPIRNCSA
jgi:hypothetical protein